eukprot:COSAG02_NODE_11592_length_1692_cov_36.008934_3_plen_81_part_00
MYTAERCYIYNKSFAKHFKTVEFPFGDDAYQAYHDALTDRVKPSNGKAKLKTDTRFQLIRDWAVQEAYTVKAILKLSSVS